MHRSVCKLKRQNARVREPGCAPDSRSREQFSRTRFVSSAETASSPRTSRVSRRGALNHIRPDIFSAFNLTSWGYQDCGRDLNNGSKGGQLSKLLLRTLPDHFNDRSIYAHFPMMTPPAMHTILARLGVADKYDFEMRSTVKAIRIAETSKATKSILKDWRNFPTAYGDFMKDITNGYGLYLAWNDTVKHRRDRLLVRKMTFPNFFWLTIFQIRDALFPPGRLDTYAKFYFDTTRKLIRQKNFSLVGSDVRSIDIVRDVVNLVPVHWASTHVVRSSTCTFATLSPSLRPGSRSKRVRLRTVHTLRQRSTKCVR